MGRIAVLGGGTMGSKIAGNFASCGHTVKLFDSDRKQMETAGERIDRDRAQLYCDGLIECDRFAGEVSSCARLDETVQDAEYIFECVFESLELKQNLFQQVSQCARTDAIICSNTMQLDLEKIAEPLPTKQNFLGVRFLYPVYYIREVELNPTRWTSTQTIHAVRQLLEPMDKVLFFRSSTKPIILNDEQREHRRQIRLEEVKNSREGNKNVEQLLPDLTFKAPDVQHGGAKKPESKGEPPAESNLNLACVICMDRSRDALIRSCNHLVACYPCARLLFQRQQNCPMCRQPIEDVIRVYT